MSDPNTSRRSVRRVGRIPTFPKLLGVLKLHTTIYSFIFMHLNFKELPFDIEIWIAIKDI